MSNIRLAAILLCCAFLEFSCLNDNPVTAVNSGPLLLAINANPITIAPNGTSNIAVVAVDQDGDELTITYSATGGTIISEGDTATFTADSVEGVKSISVKITDGRGGEVTGSASLNVTMNPALITLANQVLQQGTTGTQCLLFRAQAAEKLFMLGVQIINPVNASIVNPIPADSLAKGVPVSLQGQGLCYTKYTGTYRFIFALTHPDSAKAFTFETTHIEP